MRLTIVYVVPNFIIASTVKKLWQILSASAGVAIIPGLGGQTVVGGKALENHWIFFPKWYIKKFHFWGYADSIWLCFYMSVSHACKVKYRSSHPIQIKFGSLMRLTIVYVCAKFHKNRFNS